jgi:hypothetical protein
VDVEKRILLNRSSYVIFGEGIDYTKMHLIIRGNIVGGYD